MKQQRGCSNDVNLFIRHFSLDKHQHLSKNEKHSVLVGRTSTLYYLHTYEDHGQTGSERKDVRERRPFSKANVLAHLHLTFPTKKNGMQYTERNRTKGKFSFRSFSAKAEDAVDDPFRRKRQYSSAWGWWGFDHTHKSKPDKSNITEFDSIIFSANLS
uniref:Uncharacterized protein n=1 Tax=Romanomermis culicivorax TaxID=13658 RepID=A0A915LAX8_ROMCU